MASLFTCTQEERDTLAANIKSGVLETGYGDKRVKYASLESMRSVLAEMDDYLNPSQADARTSRVATSRR
jgi:hypothetical protein